MIRHLYAEFVVKGTWFDATANRFMLHAEAGDAPVYRRLQGEREFMPYPSLPTDRLELLSALEDAFWEVLAVSWSDYMLILARTPILSPVKPLEVG